jgi:hypothetical protein
MILGSKEQIEIIQKHMGEISFSETFFETNRWNGSNKICSNKKEFRGQDSWEPGRRSPVMAKQNKSTINSTGSSRNTSDGTGSSRNTSDGTGSSRNTSDGTGSSRNTSDGTGSSRNTSDRARKPLGKKNTWTKKNTSAPCDDPDSNDQDSDDSNDFNSNDSCDSCVSNDSCDPDNSCDSDDSNDSTEDKHDPDHPDDTPPVYDGVEPYYIFSRKWNTYVEKMRTKKIHNYILSFMNKLLSGDYKSLLEMKMITYDKIPSSKKLSGLIKQEPEYEKILKMKYDKNIPVVKVIDMLMSRINFSFVEFETKKETYYSVKPYRRYPRTADFF